MRGILVTKVKAHLAEFIEEKEINIFKIDRHLNTLSEALRKIFKFDFTDYGVALERFSVEEIGANKNENYRKLQELQAGEADIKRERVKAEREAVHVERAAEAEAFRLQKLGASYQQERSFDVAEKVASNESVGAMTNTGVGLGMMAGVGMGVGGAVGGMVHNTMGAALGNMQQPQAQATEIVPCSKCGNQLPHSAKFCLECGQQVLSENELICPSCNTKTHKGRFCLECGASMLKKCSECGTEIPPNGKFCLECGYKI
jgi:membrane protease subunit (stomatin/prohibitin family)